MKIRTAIMYLLSAFIVFQSFSCKQTNGDTTNVINDPENEAVKLTSDGWQAFESKDYPKAVGLFKEALTNNTLYADAYNGLGWTYGRMDSLEKAKTNFDIALGLEKNNIDAMAGRSFVSLGLGRYDDALTSVGLIEDSKVTFYTFRHDVSISLNDLKLVKAQSYFMLTKYAQAQAVVNELDPHNLLDLSASSYIEDLALEIENLWKTI